MYLCNDGGIITIQKIGKINDSVVLQYAFMYLDNSLWCVYATFNRWLHGKINL